MNTPMYVDCTIDTGMVPTRRYNQVPERGAHRRSVLNRFFHRSEEWVSRFYLRRSRKMSNPGLDPYIDTQFYLSNRSSLMTLNINKPPVVVLSESVYRRLPLKLNLKSLIITSTCRKVSIQQ